MKLSFKIIRLLSDKLHRTHYVVMKIIMRVVLVNNLNVVVPIHRVLLFIKVVVIVGIMEMMDAVELKSHRIICLKINNLLKMIIGSKMILYSYSNQSF